MNPEELFADDRPRLRAGARPRGRIALRHARHTGLGIAFLGEPSQGTIRAIYFEGKTVKQHSEEEYVTVYAISIETGQLRESSRSCAVVLALGACTT